MSLLTFFTALVTLVFIRVNFVRLDLVILFI